jgi:serine/threonine protein phosphatase PrpC
MDPPRYAIGDPGRAASEVPAGPPPDRVGVADVELSVASFAAMQIRAASARGLDHRAAGSVRQDAFALGLRNTPGTPEQLVAVVCDGVGSLAHSHEAAILASRCLARLGAEGMPWLAAFSVVNAELWETSEKLERDAQADGDAMATTAAALVIRREGENWVGEVAWVGDSALWHLDDSQWVAVTFPPDEAIDAEPYSTSVAALPARDATPAVRPLLLSGGALFLMSDGVSNPLRWSAAVRNTLAGWWQVAPDPFTFAAQVGFARKTHVDDRTVIGIWPDGGDARATGTEI